MSIQVTYQLTGLQGMQQRLKALHDIGVNEKRPIKSALRKTAKVLAKKVEAAAPFDGVTPDGVHIKENVQVGRSRRRSNATTETMTVGIKLGKKQAANGRTVTSEGDAWYWKLKEFGSSHEQAQPFMRPTFQQAIGELNDTFVKSLDKDIKRLERRNGLVP
jgi:HK97 gp10 family phage protein